MVMQPSAACKALSVLENSMDLVKQLVHRPLVTGYQMWSTCLWCCVSLDAGIHVRVVFYV